MITEMMVQTCIVQDEDREGLHVDASDLNFSPGFFPSAIATELGDGTPFSKKASRVRDGSLLFVEYQQPVTGLRLVVWND